MAIRRYTDWGVNQSDADQPRDALGTRVVVVWHPAAEADYAALTTRRDRSAVDTAVAKLEALGHRLPFPHSSDIRGRRASGLRELRPTRGHSRWRAIYGVDREGRFVILAVAPEASIHPRAFMAAVERARQRLDALIADHDTGSA